VEEDSNNGEHVHKEEEEGKDVEWEDKWKVVADVAEELGEMKLKEEEAQELERVFEENVE
jgi:hypothetical protein